MTFFGSGRPEKIAALQDKIIVGKILLDKAKVPDGILERVTGLADKAGRKAQLGYTRQMLSKIQVSLTEGLASMGRLEPSLGMGEVIIRLENGVRALQSHRKNLQRLRAIQGKIGDIAIELKGRLGKIAGMESWLADNIPEVCPLCGK